MSRQKFGIQKASIPFIVILIIHVILLLISIKKEGFRKTLRVLLPNIGAAYIFEYVVLNLFFAYEYRPKFLVDGYLDRIFGAVLSQAIYVPMTATFLTTLKLSWKWKVGFSIYFTIVEMIFLFLKVHFNKWWRTPYTTLLTFVYFYISDFWFKGLEEGRPVIKRISHYLSLATIQVNILYVFAVFRVLLFGFGKKEWREHFILAPLYSLFISLFYSYVGFGSSFRRSVFVLPIITAIDTLLIKMNTLKIGNWIMMFLPMHFIMLWFSRRLRNLFYYTGEKENTCPPVQG